METITFHNTEFTFERVESINELPNFRFQIHAQDHETAVKAFDYCMENNDATVKVFYYEQKSTGGRIYAFTKGE